MYNQLIKVRFKPTVLLCTLNLTKWDKRRHRQIHNYSKKYYYIGRLVRKK